jgi:hypothetical protein
MAWDAEQRADGSRARLEYAPPDVGQKHARFLLISHQT